MPENPKTPLSIPGTNPLSEHFRREMDALMSRFFGGAMPQFPFETVAQRSGLPSLDMTGAISPAIDVHETEAAIELTAELPGLGEDNIQIEVHDQRLTLRGQKDITHDEKGDLRVSERSYGSFARTMALPDTVDAEKITAEFDKGVLHITMPKTEPKDPRRKIKVSTR